MENSQKQSNFSQISDYNTTSFLHRSFHWHVSTHAEKETDTRTRLSHLKPKWPREPFQVLSDAVVTEGAALWVPVLDLQSHVNSLTAELLTLPTIFMEILHAVVLPVLTKHK